VLLTEKGVTQRGGGDIGWLQRGRWGDRGPTNYASLWGCSCACTREERGGEVRCRQRRSRREKIGWTTTHRGGKKWVSRGGQRTLGPALNRGCGLRRSGRTIWWLGARCALSLPPSEANDRGSTAGGSRGE
jgi:hypothetical protein